MRHLSDQIFFDDNIERTHAHIVDVRDSTSFSALPFKTVQGVCLRRVSPYRAILEPDYYLDEIEEVLALYGMSLGPRGDGGEDVVIF